MRNSASSASARRPLKPARPPRPPTIARRTTECRIPLGQGVVFCNSREFVLGAAPKPRLPCASPASQRTPSTRSAHTGNTPWTEKRQFKPTANHADYADKGGYRKNRAARRDSRQVKSGYSLILTYTRSSAVSITGFRHEWQRPTIRPMTIS